MKPNLTEQQWQNIFDDPQAGIYLIDKPKGENSFHAVAVLRKLLDLKKVGFSGTLDPLASGLLILATSKATRMLDWFHVLPKVYQAKIIFGQTSPTYDLEGEVAINSSAQAFGREKLEEQLNNFLGEQDQTVPHFSAKKVDGQKLYTSARKGQKITLPKAQVIIHDFKILNFTYPNLDLEITVSKGTYIRSLAHDLGEALGTGALLGDLRRISIGKFLASEALNLSQIKKEDLSKNKLQPSDVKNYLDQYPGR